MTRRTALYIRASSRDQIQHGFSIPDQLARLRAEAKAAGETVVAEYIDQARSGTSAAKRQEYQELLTGARARLFNRVRFEAVDRGHRNDLERRTFEQEMQALGVEVVYSGEPEKQAPQFRKLQRGIKGVLAEWESDETSQRTYKRQLYRATKGIWRGGPIPYGLTPDGTGWFKHDPETYPVLLWILERRAESLGHHSIARALNEGIDLGQGTGIPPTPSVIVYRRKPYLERQDPETGDVIRVPRPLPAVTWHKQTIIHICRQAVDGVYAGVLNWGHRHNRFSEDADGNAKEPIAVETGRALVPDDLLRRVRAVELAPSAAPKRMSSRSEFLLSLRCGDCGEAMHGNTSTKRKPSGKEYKYRKYRCAGRVNNPGACQMPILSAEKLEQVVIKAVFADAVERDGTRIHEQVHAAIERYRQTLLDALGVLEGEQSRLGQVRDAALAALTDTTLPQRVKAALVERADQAVEQYEQNLAQQEQVRATIDTLALKARSVIAVLTDPNLDPTRWREPAVFAAVRRALSILVVEAVVKRVNTGVAFTVHLSVSADPVGMRQNGPVVGMANTRARGSRIHRRGSSPRPLVLKTRAATGPHPLS
jgi:DNA invertase Pin-like site-specific DNA recombinase